MKKKSGSKISLRRSKKEIVDKARKGFFDGNPLLAAPHRLVCKACGCTREIVYLSYLKSGRFELGKTRMMEVVYAAPTLTGLGGTMERATPIIIRVKCKKCGSEMSFSPVSLEYLLFTVAKEHKLEQMYV
ncbi:hypothetical protein GWO13_04080 [Candidatus Bathyarchaeota archaeon]|nr:hypothetical protein [Candidatus Bathyarchaeota archaeon]